VWQATTTTDRERKQLLRTLIREIVVTVHATERRADVEIAWEGGARSELQVKLNARGPETRRLGEDTIELIRRLAEHHTDQQIAAILSRQGYRTGTGLPFTEARVRGARFRAGIPAAPPPDPESQLVTIQQAAAALNVSTHTVRRWLDHGLLPGEQAMPGAAWRIRLTDEIRARFVPDVPDGYPPLNEAAKALGVARQTVLHKVQRGELRAIQVINGRRKGLRIEVPDAGLDRLLNE
jgi:excisionase family DNA binding protein